MGAEILVSVSEANLVSTNKSEATLAPDPSRHSVSQDSTQQEQQGAQKQTGSHIPPTFGSGASGKFQDDVRSTAEDRLHDVAEVAEALWKDLTPDSVTSGQDLSVPVNLSPGIPVS